MLINFSADLYNHYHKLEEIPTNLSQCLLEKSRPFMSSEYSTVLSNVYTVNVDRNECMGVFYTEFQDLIVWVNKESHLRFISHSCNVKDNVKQTITEVFQTLQRYPNTISF